MTQSTDIQTLIDSRPFSAFHLTLFALCFFIMALDGLDTGVLGYIAPALIKDWNIERASLGPALSATLIGIGIGAMVVSPLADRIGRKRVLVGSVFAFGLFSIASAFSTSLEMLTATRLLTGIGLGTAIPNTVTLMSEYAPQRIRGRLVNAVLVGFAAGNALGGVLATYLMPHFGWHSVLLVGGLIPLALCFFLARLLPESIKFLVAHQRPRKQSDRVLQRLAPEVDLTSHALVCSADDAHKGGSPVSELLSRRYLRGTLMLWVCYFMCMVVLYVVNNWLPVLFTASGFSIHDSTLTSTIFHVGGCVGILLAGFLNDRFAPSRVVAAYLLLAALSALVISHNVTAGVTLTLILAVLGVAVSGASASMSPLAAFYYPTSSRVTGVAWMLGIGRLGGIAGTFGGALLLSFHWDFGAIFSLLAIPAVIGALCLLFLRNSKHADNSTLASLQTDS